MSGLEEKVRESIAFGTPSLLRATTAFHALTRFGALFQSSDCSAKTYGLSAPVDAIDIFVSHNWGSNRTYKFLTLALYLNLRDALLAAAFGGAAAAVLTASGILPALYCGPESQADPSSIASRLTGFTCFLLALLLAHEVKGRLGCGGPLLFVDKAVIHQTDLELQREGIRHLAAFLAHSDRMVIVFNPEMYLKRLWTVYELASMLILKPIHRIVLIPDSLPKLVLRTSCLWLLASVSYDLLRLQGARRLLGVHAPSDIENVLFLGVYFVPLVPIIFKMRHWAQQCQWMWSTVAQFRLQSTECACEEDRPMVFGNIAAFMRGFDLVESGASEAEALEAFNRFVRLKLHMVLGTLGGHTPVPYKYAVLMGMGQLLKAMDTVSAGLLTGKARSACIGAVHDATGGLAFLPCMVICLWWTLCEVKHACRTLKLLIFTCSIFTVVALQMLLFLWSKVSDPGLAVYLGMVTFWFAVTACLYRRRTSVEASVKSDPPAQVTRAELRSTTPERQTPGKRPVINL